MNKIQKHDSQMIRLEFGYEMPIIKYQLDIFEEYLKFYD